MNWRCPSISGDHAADRFGEEEFVADWFGEEGVGELGVWGDRGVGCSGHARIVIVVCW